MSRRMLTCMLLLGASAAAAAAQVYKVVGPDGKVSFTDRPPASTEVNLHLMRSGVPLALPPTRTIAQELEARQAGAASGTPVNEEAARAAREKARLQSTLRILLGRIALFDSAGAMCSEGQPATVRRYELAREGWKKRNAKLLANAETLLSTTLSAERAHLEKYARASADMTIKSLRANDAVRRTNWCEQHADELNTSAGNLSDVPGIELLL